MARQGRAGLALAVAAIGSFIGGTVGTLVLATLSVPLASLASHFQAADYAAMMACGLAAAIVLASGPLGKGLLMVAAGALLGAVGTDATGQPRFTFGRPELLDGIGFMPIAIGLAMLPGALVVHGIQPGPGVIAKEPTLFSGLVASMWIGNLMLLVINLPLVGICGDCS